MPGTPRARSLHRPVDDGLSLARPEGNHPKSECTAFEIGREVNPERSRSVPGQCRGRNAWPEKARQGLDELHLNVSQYDVKSRWHTMRSDSNRQSTAKRKRNHGKRRMAGSQADFDLAGYDRIDEFGRLRQCQGIEGFLFALFDQLGMMRFQRGDRVGTTRKVRV